jgi:hypothetical protein
MNKLWMVLGALVAPLIIAGCGGPKVDQRSYDAGYHSAGPSLVAQGVFATAACEQALEAAYLLVSKDFQNYDTQSFNTGCYTAIHDSGDPVKNANGDPVPGFNC